MLRKLEEQWEVLLHLYRFYDTMETQFPFEELWPHSKNPYPDDLGRTFSHYSLHIRVRHLPWQSFSPYITAWGRGQTHEAALLDAHWNLHCKMAEVLA